MHSLKVAQVGQRLTEDLKHRFPDETPVELDPWTVHAACLAHDLGHPPFGHAAEQELQQILAPKAHTGSPAPTTILQDSFEGNAQSFRIVTRLAARKEGERLPGDEKVGLNLTWRSCAAILKYPWRRGGQPEHLGHLSDKWGAYDPESIFLSHATQFAVDLGLGNRSVEAAIMDWADDIAYAIHDTEDFFRAHLIPLHMLRINHQSKWDDFLQNSKMKVKEAVVKAGGEWSESKYAEQAEETVKNFPDVEYSGDSHSRETLHDFASESIWALTRVVEIRGGLLQIPSEDIMRVEMLKKLTRYYVIDQADLVIDQHGQRKIIRNLFASLWQLVQDAWLLGDSNSRRVLPSRLREYCDDAGLPLMDVYGTDQARLARATVDFICSLTRILHSRLVDHGFGVGGVDCF